MAEAVQFHLEQQLPELQDLLAKELFTKDEVRTIVTKRTKFEYKLKRRAAEKSDFIAYIKYEKELEALRAKRVEEYGIKGRHSISDHSIRQHIYHLYKRAVTKFKGDVKLWLEYLEYASSTNGKAVLDRAIASALSLHPHEPAFWIKAAEWEFEGKGNATAARVLLQKGVRAVPESFEIWLAFFRLELEFAARLMERRQALGLQADTSDKTVFSAGIASIVHRHALKALGVDVGQQESFFALAHGYPQFPQLPAKLVSNLQSQPGSAENPKLAKLLMDIKLEASLRDDEESSAEDRLTKVLRCFAEAFPKINSAEVVAEAVQFLEELMEGKDDATREALADKIDTIFQVGQEENVLTAQLYLRWIALSESQGIDYSDIILEAVKLYPTNSDLLYRFAAYQMTTQTLWSDVLLTLSAVKEYEESFWMAVIAHLLTTDDIEDSIYQMFSTLRVDLLEQLPLAACFNRIDSSILDKFCSTLLNLKAVGHIVYPLWIGAKKASTGQNQNQIHELYQKWIGINSSNEDAWLQAIRFALTSGNLSHAGLLYKKALDSLPCPDQFSVTYDQIMAELE